MSLRPFANLFAFGHEDPRALSALERRLCASGEFARVWAPHPRWLCASAPLPRSEVDDHAVRKHRLAFAEGRELVERALDRERDRSLAALAERTREAPRRLVELPGDFSFLAFGRDGTLDVVRASAGLVPFYYARLAGGVTVATRLEYVLRFVDPEATLDPLPNAGWLVSTALFPDGRTFLRGVSALASGARTRIGLQREPSVERYWFPQPRALPASTPAKQEEHARRLRALLLQRLAEDLATNDTNLLSLSGGVDSSALAALTAGELHRPLRTFSLVPSGVTQARRSEIYLDALAARFQLAEHIRMPFDARVALALRRRPSPALFHVPHPVLVMLPELQRQREISVLVGGEYAGDTIGAGLGHADWARHTSPLALAVHAARSRKLGDVRTWLARRARTLRHGLQLPFVATLPSFVRARVQDEYTSWLTDQCAQARRERVPRPELAARIALDGPIAMNWEVTSAHGVRRSFPFYNRELLELAFELHPRELHGGCNDKRLLRRALAGHVPELHLERPDKGAWGTGPFGYDVDWDETLPDELAPVIDDSWWPRPASRISIALALPLQQLVTFAHALQHARARARAEHVVWQRTIGLGQGTTQRLQTHPA